MAPLTFSFAQDVLDAYAQDDRVGLVFVDEVGHRRDYTFREIVLQSQRYASVLRAFGVTRRDRVALRLSNTAKCFFTMLALERLGAVRVPCEESWTADDVARCVTDARATTLIANRRHRAELDSVRERMPSVGRFIIVGEEYDGWARLDSLVTRAQPYAGVAMESEEPSIVAGGEVYTQQALLDASIESAKRLVLVQTDRFWATFAFATREWILNTLIAAWSCGAAMVVHEGAFDPRERLELLRELEVTVLLQTPEESEALVAFEGSGEMRLPRLRLCHLSGVRSLQTT